MRNDCRASGLPAPRALLFGQVLRLILGTLSTIPVPKLHGSSRQPFLHINLPAPDSDEAVGIRHPLTVALSEGPLQVGRLDACASSPSKNRQRRVLLVIALAMRPMR